MNFFFWLNVIDKIVPILGVTGLGIGAYQLRHTRQQALTTFEDSLAREYRELVNQIPTMALLSEPLPEDEQDKAFDDFYHYFDLSNEQVFLRQINRISPGTWKYWRAGIKSNVHRPAFKCAWEKISSQAPEDFSELRRLMREDFQKDPRKWE